MFPSLVYLAPFPWQEYNNVFRMSLRAGLCWKFSVGINLHTTKHENGREVCLFSVLEILL